MIQDIRRRLATLQETLSALQSEHADLSEERRELTKARTQVDCLVRDAEDVSRSSEGRRADVTSELERVEASIAEKEKELDEETRPAFGAKRAEQTEEQDQLDKVQVTLNGLYARQGRRGQFRTRAERDEHLQGLIDAKQEGIASRKARKATLVREQEETEKERQEVEAKRVELRNELDAQKAKASEYVREVKRLEEESAEQNEHRK